MARPSKLHTIRTIATEAGVSIATVSRVLRNRNGVTESVRSKILKVAKSHHFVLETSGSRRNNIAVILALDVPVVGSYHAGILSGVSAYAFEHAVDVSLVFIQPSRQQSILDRIRETSCSAAILINPEPLVAQIPLLAEAQVPAMLINSRTLIENVGYIDNDSFGGAYEATTYLLGQGHQQIAYLRGSPASAMNIDQNERVRGYRQAMKEAGAPMDAFLVAPHTPTRHTVEAGYKAADRLLREHPEITAILASDDEMAYGAISACFKYGLRIPADISVMGFDDYPLSQYSAPPLSTVRQDLHNLGYNSLNYLELHLRGSLAILPKEITPVEILIRKSTGRVSHGKSAHRT